jgi:hypothetical protein
MHRAEGEMQKAEWRGICLALIVAGLLSARCAPAVPPTPKPLPRLTIDASVAADFAALAQTTWQQFLTVFRARADCFGDVHLQAAYELDSRAAYDPKTATVTVRVPGTPAMLQGALVHEWAHHIEFQCSAQKEMRPAFLAAQGLPPTTLWRPDDTPAEVPESEWATIPSEQYAEATIEVVLGQRQIPTTAPVTVAGVRVIAQWAAGHE